MNIEVTILRNQQGKPAGKLADAEIHFVAGELAGLKLVGFTIWERRDGNGRRVTFPGRPLIVHGDKRTLSCSAPSATRVCWTVYVTWCLGHTNSRRTTR
jgi:hypothetical protein